MSAVVDKLNLPDDVIMAAPCTPFLPNGDLNVSRFEAYADHMVQTGINGIFVNGTLGEGMSLTREERMQSLEAWMGLKDKRFKTVIAHTGCNAIRDAMALTEHAEKVGVDAVAVMCPTLFKPTSISQLVAYLKPIAAKAPNTPFLFYDINVLTGVVMDTGEVMRQCKKEIPTFSGVKFSCRELANYEMASMESEGGRYKLALGAVDDEFLPWLTLGARVPICCSFMGNIHAETKRAYLAGDMAAALASQHGAQEIGQVKRKYGHDVAVSKSMLRMMGMDLGPPRLPLQEMTAGDYAKLQDELKGVKAFQDLL